MTRYSVTVVTEWRVEVEAQSAEWAGIVAVEQHQPSSENIMNEDTYAEEVSDD